MNIFKSIRGIINNLERFWNGVRKDFEPAYEALRHGRLSVSPLNKSKIMNRAGGYTQLCFQSRMSLIVIIICVFIGAVIVALIEKDYLVILPFLIFLILVPVLLYQSDDYLLGHLGELVVADELEKVNRPQWRVFHGFKTIYGDIDHIIVCKQGVFCVETKTPRQTPKKKKIIVLKKGCLIYKNEKRLKGPVDQVKKNVDWLHIYIKKERCEPKKKNFIIPIVTFPGWRVEGKLGKKIVVCEPKRISKILEKREEKLSPDEFKNICESLEKTNKIDIQRYIDSISI